MYCNAFGFVLTHHVSRFCSLDPLFNYHLIALHNLLYINFYSLLKFNALNFLSLYILVYYILQFKPYKMFDSISKP